MPMTDPLRHGGLEHQIGADLLQALLEDPVGGVRCPGEVVHCVNVPCCSCVLRTCLIFMKRNIFISLRCLVSSTGHSWHCAHLLSRLGIAEYCAIFIDSCIVLWPVELVYFFLVLAVTFASFIAKLSNLHLATDSVGASLLILGSFEVH